MPSPRSVRLDPDVDRRLRSYAERHAGRSASSTVARLVDEGLRMEDFPGVVFVDGPSGRRARLVGGPDVWEVVRAVRAARAAEPDLGEAALVELVAASSGVPELRVRLAVAYWAAYPSEVEAFLTYAEQVEADALAAWERSRDLLPG